MEEDLRKEIVDEAKGQYNSDDIQIYNDAKVESVDYGYWVEAYVFVYADDVVSSGREGVQNSGGSV